MPETREAEESMRIDTKEIPAQREQKVEAWNDG
jgi:hypothetical protein